MARSLCGVLFSRRSCEGRVLSSAGGLCELALSQLALH